MYVTYNNLFKLLIDKGLNKLEFAPPKYFTRY